MEFGFSDEQQRIREAIAKLCTRFGDDYWLKRDREGGFPADFHQAMARDGWLGIARRWASPALQRRRPQPIRSQLPTGTSRRRTSRASSRKGSAPTSRAHVRPS